MLAGHRVDRQVADGEALLRAIPLHVHLRHAVDDADISENARPSLARCDAPIVRLAGAEVRDVLGLFVIFASGSDGFSQSWSSVRFPDEDESGALHDGRARADERDVDVLDLALAGPSRRLERAFDDVPETVDASRAEAPAEGVQRQLAVQLDASVLDEIERLAFLAEPVGLEAVDHRGGKAVVDLRDVDVFRREAGALPGEA